MKDSSMNHKKPDIQQDAELEKWLSYFEKIGEPLSFKTGHTFIMEGDRADWFYIILSGRVAAYRYTESGMLFEYWSNNMHREDRTIGIPAVLTGSLYEVSVKTLSPCELVRIGRNDLLDVLNENAAAALAMAKLISSKFIHTNSILHDYAELNSYQRFFKFIFKMAADSGEETPDGILVRLTMNQQDIADILKINRTTIYRACRKLKDEGVWDYNDKEFLIKDIEKLKTSISR